MENNGWIELLLYIFALAAITKPMGLYLTQVLDPNGRTWLDRAFKPLERLTYRLIGVDPITSRIGSNTRSPCCS